MPITGAEILGMVAACAMTHPVVWAIQDRLDLVGQAKVESGFNPLAIGLNRDPSRGLNAETRSFNSVDEAVAGTERALAAGRSVDVGLLGINLRSHGDLFPSLAKAFDADANVCAGAVVLGEAYLQEHRALCIYNSGRPDCRSPSGTNGYPEAVHRSMRSLRGEVEVAGAASPMPSPPVQPLVGTAFQRVQPAPQLAGEVVASFSTLKD